MKLLKGIIITILGLIAILYITDTDYLLKAVRTVYAKGYTTAFLEDYKEFDNAEILNGTPQPWPIHKNYNSVSETERLQKYNDAYGTTPMSSLKMTAFGLKIIMMVLMKIQKPTLFQWPKVMCLGLWAKPLKRAI